jgi:hypothetical protein
MNETTTKKWHTSTKLVLNISFNETFREISFEVQKPNPKIPNSDRPGGVDFTNILLAAITTHKSQKHKKGWGLTVFFALLGSVSVKAAHKMLLKSTPSCI